MEWTRREAMFSLAGAGLAASAGWTAAEPAAGPSLDAIARRSGRRFGSAVGAGPRGALHGAFADPRYRQLLVAECGLLVAENELKWTTIRPDPASFRFEPFDRLLAFGEEHGLGMRGHTLLWHHPDWMPQWVASHDFGSSPASAAELMLREHVATVCRRYRGRIHSYDVVNEAVDNRTGEMRETAFSRAMGGPEAVVDLAFRVAREAAPQAQLVYNDYMSWDSWSGPHRAGVLRLLEGFRRRNVPVDALGVQSHIGTGNNEGARGFDGRDEAEWRRFLDSVTAMGYDLLITEFDVHDMDVTGDIQARDRAVADLGGAYLDLMLSYDRMGDILVWGMSDRYSWLQPRGRRADHLPKRPCPYDSEFDPKPLRSAIALSLAQAAPRRPPAA